MKHVGSKRKRRHGGRTAGGAGRRRRERNAAQNWAVQGGPRKGCWRGLEKTKRPKAERGRRRKEVRALRGLREKAGAAELGEGGGRKSHRPSSAFEKGGFFQIKLVAFGGTGADRRFAGLRIFVFPPNVGRRAPLPAQTGGNRVASFGPRDAGRSRRVLGRSRRRARCLVFRPRFDANVGGGDRPRGWPKKMAEIGRGAPGVFCVNASARRWRRQGDCPPSLVEKESIERIARWWRSWPIHKKAQKRGSARLARMLGGTAWPRAARSPTARKLLGKLGAPPFLLRTAKIVAGYQRASVTLIRGHSN